MANHSLLLDQQRPALVLPKFVYGAKGKPLTGFEASACLPVTQYLQTGHSRVFACGAVIHPMPVHGAIAQQEAKVAVWNALFVPNRQVDYGAIAEGYDRFARVGRALTRRRGQSWTASASNSTDLTHITPLPSYCKVITDRGRLQGAYLLGDGASELIQLLAPMVGQSVDSLLDVMGRSLVFSKASGLAEVVRVALAKSQQARWQGGHWRRDWAENWFNWRRSR
ncbi:MAG: hypothetical protein HC800_01210 [Phormidesmis sp. RL_2_1]|nr:hypothetical protein [Phormidesmis sp. RL_2_1]